jgi:hypothetical protein
MIGALSRAFDRFRGSGDAAACKSARSQRLASAPTWWCGCRRCRSWRRAGPRRPPDSSMTRALLLIARTLSAISRKW